MSELCRKQRPYAAYRLKCTFGSAATGPPDPGRWNDLVEGWRLSDAAGVELKFCYEAARKTGKEQRCSISVRPPTR